MPDNLRCARCGSGDILPSVLLQTFPAAVQAAAPERPDALFFPKNHYSPLKARVCCSCGFADLFVTDPAELKAAYLKSKEASGAGDPAD
jgi:hypothetical protein